MSQPHVNVDPAEVDKFDALATRWWDPNSEFKTLHDINPLRLQWIERHCGGLQGKRALDVGCGGGLLSEAMANAGAEVTGIDLAGSSLRTARLHLLESGLEVDYRQVPVEELAEECPGTFDVVSCMEMLEHVPDPASVVRACASLVKPGGELFLSTINRNPKAYAFVIIGAEYLLRMLPTGTHDYDKFITPAELGRWIRQAELETIGMTGLTYNPLSRHYRLDDNDISVNYLVHCHRPA
jgi:2-polyprenyl-6-hydroxyphenyl methylase/3-demethylubiquinone-9 3-methyltransferase